VWFHIAQNVIVMSSWKFQAPIDSMGTRGLQLKHHFCPDVFQLLISKSPCNVHLLCAWAWSCYLLSELFIAYWRCKSLLRHCYVAFLVWFISQSLDHCSLELMSIADIGCWIGFERYRYWGIGNWAIFACIG